VNWETCRTNVAAESSIKAIRLSLRTPNSSTLV